MSMKEWPKLFFSNPFSREEKKMSKKYEYKVGDKVRVRDWADMEKEFGVKPIQEGIESPVYFSPEMRKFCGKVFTVRKIETTTNRIIRLAGIDDWVFGLEHLILVESAPETKSDEKTKPTCDQSERIAALEAEIKKLKEQVKGEDPMGVTMEKSKAKALKPILPRVLSKRGDYGKKYIATAENYTQLLRLEKSGWKDGPSVLNWHRWSGGKCPVTKDTQVIICTRNGLLGARFACDWRWEHETRIESQAFDIVAYAVIELPKLEGP